MENMKQIIKDEFKESLSVLSSISQSEHLINKIEFCVTQVCDAFKKGNKLILIGNGGSAADCQHIAGEYVSRFMFDRPGLPAIALTTDTSILTAIGNDYGYEVLFSRQIESIANKGDILIAYSTSGNSQNIVRGLIAGRELGLLNIGFTGNRNGKMNDFCDCVIDIPSLSTPRIQEGHAIVGHIICFLVEKVMFGSK